MIRLYLIEQELRRLFLLLLMPEPIPMDLIHARVSKVRYTKTIYQVSKARITLGRCPKTERF